MITLEIQETNRFFKLPEELGECDSRQYREACLLIYRYQQNEMSYEDFRVEMLYKLLDLEKGSKKGLFDSEKLELHSNIFSLSCFVDSFFEKDEHEEVDKLNLKLYYIDNKIRETRVGDYDFIGPADEFEDISWGQYMDALEVYYLIENQPSKELYYELMAIFYLPMGKRYDRDKTNRYLKHIQKCHFGEVYGFFLLFASFQSYLFSATIFYQGNELDLSILFQDPADRKKETEPKSKIPGIGMKSIEFQLAGSGVFGPLKEMRKTNFWETILRIYDIRKSDLDARAERERQEEIAKSKNK
ncbi:hypothetical protein VS868_12010 [Salinimicrobium sp. 3283s]|uniref:hypothetical protein n=1 Tax=Salinimicrobium sp. 3283s TaxID=3114359 RepID=UPI0031E710C4